MANANKPIEHLQEAEKLEASLLVDLYELKLVTEPVTVRIKNDNTVTYLGNVYEGMPVQLSGESRSADDEEARPKLRIFNPEGLFNSLIRQKLLDRAVITRQRVLRRHLEGNVKIFQQRRWYVSRVAEVVAGQSILLELRSMTEGPNFQVPARMYTPPEFPMVRLK